MVKYMLRTKYRAKDDGELSAQLSAGEESEKIETSAEISAVDIGVNAETLTKESNTNEDKDTIIQVALEQGRKRAQSFMALEKQAQRLGVFFNAAQALQDGMSLEEAKSIILANATSQSDQRATITVRLCTVKASELIWPEKIDEGKKQTAIQILEKNNVILR
ncbi:head decoration protein [Bartonella bovis]|uniref:Phage protein n=1 Tax=Bartonella bovis m02 TaxID=1094492 RepID=N6V9T4_9HYPH|nr:head decoration protein [Bartonella bovis]ENN89976.1 phage protein [Bartonella bovis m02]